MLALLFLPFDIKHICSPFTLLLAIDAFFNQFEDGKMCIFKFFYFQSWLQKWPISRVFILCAHVLISSGVIVMLMSSSESADHMLDDFNHI